MEQHKVSQLGYYHEENELRFKIYATKAWAMLIEVYEAANSSLPIARKIVYRNECMEDNIFSVCFSGIKRVHSYVWRMVNEDYSYSSTIIDPFAKGIHYFEGEWRNLIIESVCYKAPKPNISWEETILYELHVGHFTHEDLKISEEKRGTFSGLQEKLPYLKQLGVTSIELMPIFKWNGTILHNKHPYTGELLEDVWGYNPISFFAIDERYGVNKESESAINEFRELIEKAHELGLEIILDVVYNHTGEGGEDGVSLHFKHLAPEIYYKYDERGKYLNCSGTGNTLNTNHPFVKELIIQSLLYWSQEIGVDGFRFDLASILGQDADGRWMRHSLLHEITQHPLLSKVKLISESWDAKGSYDVGRMPLPFREWSDYFRDNMRKFIKGEQGTVKAVSDCLLGKEIYFSDPLKNKDFAIHFITAHDGFTMWDLLSYNEKHNLANGENNRDGNNANYSYNWGVEGETQEEAVLVARKREMRNLMCLLLLSQGVPMLLMGDEIGRTQYGNNNAFCQNDKSVWVDWQRGEDFKDQLLFTQNLIHLRKQLDYFKGDKKEAYTVSWHGIRYGQPDWSYYSRSIALYIQGEESLFIIANSYCESLQFELPPIEGEWLRLIDTSKVCVSECMNEVVIKETRYCSMPYSICLFKAIDKEKSEKKTPAQ